MAKRTRSSRQRRRTIRELNRKIESLGLESAVNKRYKTLLTELRDDTPHAWVKERINEIL